MKKYTKEELEEISLKKVAAITHERKIPYFRLAKKEMISNILAAQEGKKPPHIFKPPKMTTKERRESLHKLTPRIKNFCYEYATYRGIKTQKEWGKIYGVTAGRIGQWLTWKEVQDLIEDFRSDLTQRLQHKFSNNVEHVVDKLIEIVDSKGSKETRRKAIVDFLGFAGVTNINAMKVNMKQNSVSAAIANAKSVTEMSDEEIDEEINQIEQLKEDG